MFVLSKIEEERLATCDVRLQKLVRKIIETWNIQVLQGHRNQEEQDKFFAEGKTKLKWPNGEHNALPSRAIDMCPVE